MTKTFSAVMGRSLKTMARTVKKMANLVVNMMNDMMAPLM
jgi:hypothetical protein